MRCNRIGPFRNKGFLPCRLFTLIYLGGIEHPAYKAKEKIGIAINPIYAAGGNLLRLNVTSTKRGINLDRTWM